MINGTRLMARMTMTMARLSALMTSAKRRVGARQVISTDRRCHPTARTCYRHRHCPCPSQLRGFGEVGDVEPAAAVSAAISTVA